MFCCSAGLLYQLKRRVAPRVWIGGVRPVLECLSTWDYTLQLPENGMGKKWKEL